MKTALNFFIAVMLIGIISCQNIVAQPTPVITQKYTNDEIGAMINKYKASHARDIRPAMNFKQQLVKDFPDSRDIEWETVADIYEAEFEIGHTDYKAYYDKEANLLMYVLEIREADIPAIVKNTAISKYPNFKIDEALKIVKGTETLYRIELEKNDMDVKATFRENGTFIKEIID